MFYIVCYRYGDRLESVDGVSIKGLSKSSIGELIHQFTNELTLSLSILRVCPPDPVKMRVYLPHNSRTTSVLLALVTRHSISYQILKKIVHYKKEIKSLKLVLQNEFHNLLIVIRFRILILMAYEHHN